MYPLTKPLTAVSGLPQPANAATMFPEAVGANASERLELFPKALWIADRVADPLNESDPPLTPARVPDPVTTTDTVYAEPVGGLASEKTSRYPTSLLLVSTTPRDV